VLIVRNSIMQLDAESSAAQFNELPKEPQDLIDTMVITRRLVSPAYLAILDYETTGMGYIELAREDPKPILGSE